MVHLWCVLVARHDAEHPFRPPNQLDEPKERVGAGGLRPAPADDRREVTTGLDGAPEVGRRGFGSSGAREHHADVARAHERAALEVDVDDDVLDRLDVDVRAGFR